MGEVAEVRKAMASSGYQELDHVPDFRLLSFRAPNAAGSLVHVYYATGSVCVIDLPQYHGKSMPTFHYNVVPADMPDLVVGSDQGETFRLESEGDAIVRHLGVLDIENAKLERARRGATRQLQKLDHEGPRRSATREASEATHKVVDVDNLRQRDELTRELSHLQQHASLSRASSTHAGGLKEDQSATRKNDVVPFVSQKSIFPKNDGEVESPFRARGNQCYFALHLDEYQQEFGTAWSSKSVNNVALGRGYLILYDDGSVTWWDIPEALDAKMRESNAANSSLCVKYVVLGTDENYYLKYTNGKMEWRGPDSFAEALKDGIQERQLVVDKVALAPNQGWFILWSNGTYDYENVPTSLEEELSARQRPVKDLTIGPGEEWFIIFKDHAVRAYNLPDSLYAVLARIQTEGGRVRRIIFGENSSWYVRFWDGK